MADDNNTEEDISSFFTPRISLQRFNSSMEYYFNQLEEPERGQAKNNYNVTFAHAGLRRPLENFEGFPDSISGAILLGFDWGATDEGYAYWQSICLKYIMGKKERLT